MSLYELVIALISVVPRAPSILTSVVDLGCCLFESDHVTTIVSWKGTERVLGEGD